MLVPGILCLLAFSCPLDSQEIKVEQQDEAMEILSGYTANRSKLKKFAVAARVERTKTYKNQPSKSYSLVEWYICCFDEEKNRRRYDTIRRGISIGRLESTKLVQTLFINQGMTSYKRNSELEQSFDDDELTVDEREKLRIQQPMIFIDPFNLPVSSGSDLDLAERFPKRRLYETELKSENITLFNKNLVRTDIHFILNKRARVSKALRFQKFGDSLVPTKTALYRTEADGRKLEMSSVETRWGQLKSGSIVPVALTVSRIGGDPRKPTSFSDYEVEFFLDCQKQFSERTVRSRCQFLYH